MSSIILEKYNTIDKLIEEYKLPKSKICKIPINFFSEKNSEYYKFIEQVGTHLFGNNVDEFFNIRENDNGEGKWEIILENPKVEDWQTIDVYLIPIDFEID